MSDDDNTEPAKLTDSERIEIEAATLRRLLEHLDARKDVQNIDLMNLAGFCRNCLSKWYRAEAAERGHAVADEAARERIYGMPYATWKARYQQPAAPAEKAAFDAGRRDG